MRPYCFGSYPFILIKFASPWVQFYFVAAALLCFDFWIHTYDAIAVYYDSYGFSRIFLLEKGLIHLTTIG